MAQLQLKARRRKRAKYSGTVIRVSDVVLGAIRSRRKREHESNDSILRRIFGIENIYGDPQPLITGWLEPFSQVLFADKADALGRAAVEAAKRKQRNLVQPIRMRQAV